ncbi:MAG TPA: T9SS type A sorting domain-containing protein [Flavobacteriales bacterium]|nr:T9SS type A sorting domain-containing protein [Flavobacteriales bacterium]
MRKFYSAFAMLFSMALCSATIAQINYGGTPSFLVNQETLSNTKVVMPAIDRALLDQADAVTDQIKEVPWRFGVENEVNYTTSTNGFWTIEDEENVWRLAIECPSAISVSVRFSEFNLEKGAYLFVWSKDSHQFIGRFDHRSKKDWGGLATGILTGSEVIVELHQPTSWGFTSAIAIDQIVYGYRRLLLHPESTAAAQRGPFGNSGDCNINVNCPEGALWATEKRSVALIVQGGFAVCTGALINNTLNDGTPYFLTANHCLGNPGSWLYYFNHESATCAGNSGPTNQSISGATLIVGDGASDFALLELSEVPPASFNVQYAGWDASGNTPLSATGIHHPSGDVKKICFEEDSPYFATQAGAAVWMIDQWELGVTESGSSGSPLFDDNHRIIGQLYGGAAACVGNGNNGQLDYYGRFNESFTLGAAEYLDPTGSGMLAWDGFPDGAVSYANDAGVIITGAPEELLCGTASISLEIVLMNTGTENLTSATIMYNINSTTSQQVNWNGNLAQYDSETITIPPFTSISGENTVTVVVSNPNGVMDENNLNNSTEVSFTTFSGETFDFQLAITLDEYGSETTWEIKQLGQVIYSGGPYNDGTDGEVVLVDLCLEEGCYIFTINDDYGDGICCEYGTGFWAILDGEGDIITISDGEFGDSETDQFCTIEASIEGVEYEVEGHIYPNPASDLLTVDFPKLEGRVFISDITGRTMVDLSFDRETQTSIDVSNWSEGLYIVTWMGKNNEIMTTRITVAH